MASGTEVTDIRLHRRIGYWDQDGLAKDLPRNAHPPLAENPYRARKNSYALLNLAESDPQSAFALEAATWIVLNTPDGPEVEKAAEVILRNHVTGSNLVTLCQGLPRLRPRCAKPLLRAALDQSGSSEVRANACFALAQILKEESNDSGDEQVAGEAERLFQRVVAGEGQVLLEGRPLAERAQQELVELQKLSIGKEAPDIDGEDLSGRKMKLSDFRGKVVLLTFWGTWCSACIEMFPEERLLVERWAGKPFVLLGVNSDHDEGKVEALLKKERITWRSFRDRPEPGPIVQAWNVGSFPTTYLLDGHGVIRYKNLRGATLADAVDTLMSQK